LAYHGVSIDDEDQWRSGLYMSPAFFESRLELLRKGGYTVLPLAEALTALRERRLPPRCVTLTFDDGNYDFYCRVVPLLQAYGFPATVYLTTYYSEYNRPIFRLVCSYMLWKRSLSPSCPATVSLATLIEDNRAFSLTSEAGRQAIVEALVVFSREEGLSGRAQNDLAARLANLIGYDYDELCQRRLLHLMNSAEVEELARRSVDFQLHTHRHNCPHERQAFEREIRDNRTRIERLTRSTPSHFCYPSGRYQPYFLPWLEGEHIESATTCDPGLASAHSSALLLPRFVDTQNVPAVRFEAWLSGAAAWVPGPRVAADASR
jgi:peptidoglycan/xylan/chitin deacetylase (PgdA/CDA1 family)